MSDENTMMYKEIKTDQTEHLGTIWLEYFIKEKAFENVVCKFVGYFVQASMR